jgi:hypothetical protein
LRPPDIFSSECAMNLRTANGRFSPYFAGLFQNAPNHRVHSAKKTAGRCAICNQRPAEYCQGVFSKFNGSAPVPGRSKLETAGPSEILENRHYADIAAAGDGRAPYFENMR